MITPHPQVLIINFVDIVISPSPQVMEFYFCGFRNYPLAPSYEIFNFVDSVTTPGGHRWTRFFKWFFEQAASGAGNVLDPPVVDYRGWAPTTRSSLVGLAALLAGADGPSGDSTGLDACCQE